MQTHFIGGDWGETARESGYIKKLTEACAQLATDEDVLRVVNGGDYRHLESQELDMLKWCNACVWAPNIPNDKPKLVSELKKKNPKMVLVITKNNRQGKYSPKHLVARMLKVRANLMIEFTKPGDQIAATIVDPLGNLYCEAETDVDVVAYVLMTRIKELHNFRRVGSTQIGKAIEPPLDLPFYKLAREFGDKFHELIHAANQDRFLGNLAFRCERGFPAFKHNTGKIFVSRRNVDKRHITPEGFVACEPYFTKNGVGYYGEHKPSVDAAVQIRLFQAFQKIRYMMHAHVYVEGVPFTQERFPCGAFDEAEDVLKLVPDHNQTHFAVNLLGHGSIVFAKDIDYFKDIKYISREMWEDARVAQPVEQ